MWNFVIAGIGALANLSVQKRAVKAQKAAFERQVEQDKKNRELAKQDAENKFVDMAKAADKAGINRLTALRSTGGAGFGSYGGITAQVPVLSRASFMETFGGAMLKTWATNKINEPIDAYNDEVRKLELEQRRVDIKLGKQQLDALRSIGGGIGSDKGNNPEATNSRTAVTTPFGTITPSPVSDAEASEQRYGDIVQEAVGLSVLLSDLYRSGLIAAETAFGKRPQFNDPKRGEMIKKRWAKPKLSVPMDMEKPNFGEQWWMYAP